MRFIILISFVLLLVLSCNDNPVTPTNDQPGRRDYVWTVDTLNAPHDSYYRMWASSPSDIWCTGPGDWRTSISHFDGSKWLYYEHPEMNVPHSIFGFSSSNIYVGTGGGGIWKFDGTNWQQIANLTKDGHSDIVFDNMWGESIQGIIPILYATGAYPDENGYANMSVIARFSNNKWEMFNTDSLYGIVEHLYRNPPDNKVYIQVIGGHNYGDSTTIWEYNNGNYHKLYSNIWVQGLQANISLINEEVYFIIGSKIEKRVNNQFQIIVNVENPNFYQRIWRRNSKDIFLMMVDGLAITMEQI